MQGSKGTSLLELLTTTTIIVSMFIAVSFYSQNKKEKIISFYKGYGQKIENIEYELDLTNSSKLIADQILLKIKDQINFDNLTQEEIDYLNNL
jgi:hypothetical protein